MRYRITHSRWDVPTAVYKEFETVSDDEAKKTFKEISEKKENAWETMFLYRVDQVQIEKLTVLDTVRDKHRDGYANDL